MKLRSHPFLRLFPARARRFPKTSLLVLSLTLLSTCYYFLWFNGYYTHALDEEEMAVEEPGQDSNNHENSTGESRILLVTALFPLSNVKHTQEEYTSWLSNFLERIETDTYFYTTPDIAALATSLHAKNPNHNARLTMNTSFSSPFDPPPLAKWKHQYEEMHEWDRERARHTAELYAVWNAKPYLLNSAIKTLHAGEGRSYDYAFWIDAGSFRRPHVYSRWPDFARVESVWDDAWRLSKKVQDGFTGDAEGAWMGEPEARIGLRGKGDLMFFPTYEVPGYEKDIVGWKKEMGPVDMDFSEGTFFGSTPDTISWYTDVFYKYHDHYIATQSPSAISFNGKPYPPFHFVGKDQTLINAIIFLYPHRFFTVVSPAHQGLLPPATMPSSPISPSPSTPEPLPSSTISTTPTFRYILSRFFTSLSSKIKNKLRGKENGPFGDEWFYFQFWLSSKSERSEMCQMWDSLPPQGGGAFWVVGRIVRWWEGWVLGWNSSTAGDVRNVGLDGREMTEDEVRSEQMRRLDSGRCRVTRGFPIVRLLEALYGERWVDRVRAWGE